MSLKLTEQKSSCRFIWRSVSYLLKAKFLRRASDKDYEKYRQLAAPKILYSCGKLTTKLSANFEKCLENPNASYCTQDLVETKVDVGYQAGVGSFVTYNSLLRDVQASCIGEFKRLKILASDK